jgi:hypothetical protein
MTQLSPHFSLEEMVHSATALRWNLENTPSDAQIANLRTLCLEQMEPVRALLGVPIHVDSGFRSPLVNRAVGSTASHSDHLDGNACDFVPIGPDLSAAFDLIRASGIPFKQLIIECGAWIHISRASVSTEMRQEALLASKNASGQWVYLPA